MSVRQSLTLLAVLASVASPFAPPAAVLPLASRTLAAAAAAQGTPSVQLDGARRSYAATERVTATFAGFPGAPDDRVAVAVVLRDEIREIRQLPTHRRTSGTVTVEALGPGRYLLVARPGGRASGERSAEFVVR